MIKTRERVIIDTDPGIDDALALLLALRSPELEVVAITTVNGNVSLDMATRNAFTVLSLIPPGQRPPVAAGAPAPLEKTPYFATFVHGDDGLGKLDRYRDASGRPRYTPVDVPLSARSAAEEILFHVSSAEPQAMTLIAIGPAARRVFHAGIPLTVVGLDVTRRVRLTRKTVETEVAPRQTEISQFVCDCTSDLLGFCENREGKASFPLHDPLAIGVLIDPSLVSLEPMHIEVETKGELTEGMTLADRRPIRSELKEPPNAEVCVDVDASRFLALFLGRLCPK
jgi:purine nucleosidase/pyrimidine-specific ribonucleoside hydrolase